MVPDASSPTSKRGSAIRGIWLRGKFLRGHFSLPAMNRTRFQCYEPQRNAKCAYLFATSNALVAGRAAIHFAGQRPTRGSAFPGSPEVAFGQLTVPACDHLVVAFTHRRSTPLLGGNALRGLMKNVEMGGACGKPRYNGGPQTFSEYCQRACDSRRRTSSMWFFIASRMGRNRHPNSWRRR